MSAVQFLNNGAEVARKSHALTINIGAAKGLMEVLRSNLGPKGTMKMLVSGAGDIKMTKDGSVLLKEMQIQHPTAMMIARTATAQDDETGDGTTTCVLLIGETLKQAERYLAEGVHPRVITEGIEIARTKALEFLDAFKTQIEPSRTVLMQVARCALATKVHPDLVEQLSGIVVDAVEAVKANRVGGEIDLHMVEIMAMQHKMDSDSRLVRGIVMDHGSRHPDARLRHKNAYILTCNVSLEYDRTEVTATFQYSSAEQRDRMVAAERKTVDDRVRKIIELKRQMCPEGSDKSFVVINQGGIDPISLDLLAKEGIMALRRAKRRNMERLVLACGGVAVNSVDDISPEVLGFAGAVYEQTLGEDKFTFVEDCKNPSSVTILLKGPNKHTLNQIQDAVRDGLRAIKSTIEDGAVVLGGGSFETACSLFLHQEAEKVHGRAKRGVQVFADALLIVPRTLAANCGKDHEDAVIELQDAHRSGKKFGLDAYSGECVDCMAAGIFDGYKVKRQILTAAPSIAEQLLLVDEIMRAGRGTAPKPGQ